MISKNLARRNATTPPRLGLDCSRRVVVATCQLCILLLAPASVSASIEHVPVGSDLTGVRTTQGDNGSGGLTGNGHYYPVDAFRVDWEITEQSSGEFKYRYVYTFSGAALEDGSHGISNFALDISDDALLPKPETDEWTLVDGVVEDAMFMELESETDGYKILTRLSERDGEFPLVPGDLSFITGAVKFEIGQTKIGEDEEADAYRYAFYSNRAPVWGSFFIKNGHGSWPDDLTSTTSDTSNGVTAFVANNALFQLNESSWGFDLNDKNNWIAVPNGEAVPEPASAGIWALIGMGILGVFTARRRRRYGLAQH